MHDVPLPVKAVVKAPLWLLVMITISGTLAMHMFVPALPAAAQTFGVSSAAMQATISVYILGLAGGQLVYGPLSDGLGRRPMLLFGLALYAAASLLAAMATSVHVLVFARLLQALGGCAGLALGRAMVRDTSSVDDSVRDLALLNLMVMVGPGLAPLVGSLLSVHFGWRAIFVMLAVLGSVTLLFSWRRLPETSRPSGQVSVGALLRDYGQLLRFPAFVAYALAGGCITTSIYGFIAAAPFLFVDQLHRPLQEVGAYLGMLIIGMFLGNALTRRLIRSVPIERLLVAGSLTCLVSALALLLMALLGQVSVISVMLPMFLMTLGAGISSPAAMTKALGVDAHLVGSAAGFYGFAQMVVGALCTTAVGLGSNPALAAGVVLSVAALLGQLGFWLGMRGERALRAQKAEFA
jgi:DHA1 family bicyclomycin/chloramphenicol resistance-like MFS transporter